MIYLARHGETEFNLARRHRGQVDSPLTQLGRRQARGAGRALAGLVDPQNTIIFSSPLGRALMTAVIISGTMGIVAPIIKDPDLKEIYMGSAEGMTEDEMSMCWPQRQSISANDSLSFESPDGEDLHTLSKRLSRALRGVTAHDAKSCIIVCHGVAGRVLRTIHLGLHPAEAIRFEAPHDALFRLEPGIITRMPFEVD